jgi:hypothetical protein
VLFNKRSLLMAEVQINTVQSQITVADGEALLTPELLDMLVQAVRRQLQADTLRQRDLDSDRKLSDTGR